MRRREERLPWEKEMKARAETKARMDEKRQIPVRQRDHRRMHIARRVRFGGLEDPIRC